MKDENLRLRDHDPEELCFYSKATTDFEFLFPFGWGELWGVADRTDYDLTQHQNTSGKDLTYFDQEIQRALHPLRGGAVPWRGAQSCWPSWCDAYDEEVVGQDKKGNDDVRAVLHLHPALAPYKAAVLPLSKKLSRQGPRDLRRAGRRTLWSTSMRPAPSASAIAARTRSVLPCCITVDFDTVGDADTAGDNCVTVRERDTMEQVRVPISELKAYLAEKLAY